MARCITGDVATLQELSCIVESLFNNIIPFAGLAAFVMLIIGGFQYLTSGGDPQKTKQAQGLITGTIIGIVATLAVYIIFRLIGAITGLDQNILKFEIPG